MQHLAVRLVVSVITFIVGITTTGLLSAHRSDTSGSNSALKQEVLRIERQYLDAHVQRDAATLNRILADDFAFTHRRGRYTNKAERLALVQNSDFHFEAIDTRGVDVKVNGDRAIVMGQATVTGQYKDRIFTSPPYGFIRVYQKRQGRWQVAAVQVTRAAWQ